MTEPRPYGEKAQPADGDTGAGPVTAASISLPKCRGAIRGLDEKVTASPPTGTASLSLAIQLALSYNSGEGNALFGRPEQHGSDDCDWRRFIMECVASREWPPLFHGLFEG